MPRPIPGEQPIPLSPISAAVSGYAPPSPPANGQFAPNHQYAPNPFAVANPTAPPPANGRAMPKVGELLSAFKRRWPLALMIGSVVAALMAAAIWLAMPSGKHRVKAELKFSSAFGMMSSGSTDYSSEKFNREIDNQKKQMETNEFLDRVGADPKVSRLGLLAGVPVEERASVIRNMLTSKRDTDEILTVSLNGDEPLEMQIILQTLVDEFIRVDVDKQQLERRSKMADLSSRLGELNNKITAQKKSLQEKLNSTPGANQGEIPRQLAASKIADISRELSKAESDARDAKSARDALADQLSRGELPYDPEDLEKLYKESPQVTEKEKLLLAARNRIEDLKKLLPTDPGRLEGEEAVRSAEKAVAQAKKDAISLNAESLKSSQKAKTDKLMSDFGRKYQAAQRSAEELKTTLDSLVKQQQEFKVGNVDIRSDDREIEQLETQKADYTKQKSELEMQDKSTAPRIEVFDKAQISFNHNLKTKWAFSSIAAVAGLLAVCLLVSYVEWRNRRVDGVDQVVTELGMRVIGTIPAFPSRAALRSGETGANQNWRFILNESVNSTRTMLLHTARTQQMQVILVTSAMQGEGKTSLSSQLATSMATAGLRTLILDCDLRNPSMQKLFDVPVAPGCAEILLQEIDISDAVQQTSVPNLWIIPAGQCNHRVIAALAQGHPIEALLNRLRGQFDIIIVDSCPILPVADTLLVAQHVDGVVFSILQDVSQLPKVQDASERMIQLNIPLLGAVVNGIKPDIQAYGYNYVKQLPA
jgi:succinoglycan biosynthesis transport protein ExoP